MLFTCPAAAAHGGVRRARGGRRHACIDIHCHVHVPAADEMIRDIPGPGPDPNLRFASELSRATTLQQMRNIWPSLTSVDQRLRDMDKMGVDVQAISPSPNHFLYWLPSDVARRASRIINEHLAGIVRAHPDRFVALAHVPLQDAEAAAAELEHCVGELGFRGAEIGTNVAGAEISRGRDVFWAKAQELGIVLFMHPHGFTGGERLSDHYFINVIGNPLDTTVAIGYLVFDGILERFPKLKVVAAHGGGYAAHYPGRMDHVWSARADARTALRKAPRRSLAKVYFDTIVFDREQLRHLVTLWGADHVLVGTDYPFDMGMYDPRGFIGGCAFLKNGERAKLLGLNAARLLKIGTKGSARLGR
jgi:aminocarboxymuconate-semialdehyde decarboxylase